MNFRPVDIHPRLLADSEFSAFKAAFDSAFQKAGEVIESYEKAAQRAQIIANIPGGAECAVALMRAAGSSSGLGFSEEISSILRELLTPYAACASAVAPMALRAGVDASEAAAAARRMQEEGLGHFPPRLAEVVRVYFEQAELILSSPPPASAPSSRRGGL